MKIIKSIFVYIFFLAIILATYFGLVYFVHNISTDLANTVLEYIKVLIWPIVVLTVCFSFHAEISHFIRRIIAGKFAGAEVTLAPSQEKANESSLNEKLEQTQPAGKDDIEKVIEEKENAIVATTQQKDELQKQLVEKEIELDFERIYNIIYRSQIDLLRSMVVSDHYGLTFITNHFQKENSISAAFNNWNVFQYIAFLFNNGLIEQRDNHTYAVTIKGRAFLQYLNIMGYQKYGI